MQKKRTFNEDSDESSVWSCDAVAGWADVAAGGVPDQTAHWYNTVILINPNPGWQTRCGKAYTKIRRKYLLLTRKVDKEPLYLII